MLDINEFPLDSRFVTSSIRKATFCSITYFQSTADLTISSKDIEIMLKVDTRIEESI